MKRFFVMTCVKGEGYNPYSYAWFEVGDYLKQRMAERKKMLFDALAKGDIIEEIKFTDVMCLFFQEGAPTPERLTGFGCVGTLINARESEYDRDLSNSMVIDRAGAWWEIIDKHTGITVKTKRILWEIFQ